MNTENQEKRLELFPLNYTTTQMIMNEELTEGQEVQEGDPQHHPLKEKDMKTGEEKDMKTGETVDQEMGKTVGCMRRSMTTSTPHTAGPRIRVRESLASYVPVLPILSRTVLICSAINVNIRDILPRSAQTLVRRASHTTVTATTRAPSQATSPSHHTTIASNPPSIRHLACR